MPYTKHVKEPRSNDLYPSVTLFKQQQQQSSPGEFRVIGPLLTAACKSRPSGLKKPTLWVSLVSGIYPVKLSVRVQCLGHMGLVATGSITQSTNHGSILGPLITLAGCKKRPSGRKYNQLVYILWVSVYMADIFELMSGSLEITCFFLNVCFASSGALIIINLPGWYFFWIGCICRMYPVLLFNL